MEVINLADRRRRVACAALADSLLHRWACWIESGRQSYYGVLRGTLSGAMMTSGPASGTETARGRSTRPSRGSKPPPAVHAVDMREIDAVLQRGLKRERLTRVFLIYASAPRIAQRDLARTLGCHEQTIAKTKAAAIKLIVDRFYP